MGQTLTSLNAHIIFSTKSRIPAITADIRIELHPYFGGIANNVDCVALAVGGVDDHVHCLISIPSKMAVAELVRLLKSNSSKWIRQRFPKRDWPGWQTGYGAFSVSKSNLADVVEYINQQEAHHKVMSFQEEFTKFLERHDVPYDPRYVWE